MASFFALFNPLSYEVCLPEEWFLQLGVINYIYTDFFFMQMEENIWFIFRSVC